MVGRVSPLGAPSADPAVRARLIALYEAAVAAVDPRRVLPRYARLEPQRFVFERPPVHGGGRGGVVALSAPDRHRGGRWRVLAIGKAAEGSVAGLLSVPGMADAIDDGLQVLPASRPTPEPVRDVDPAVVARMGWPRWVGEHPWPGEGSLAAGREVLAFAARATPADRHLVLLSGGASALCVAPADGLTLADKDQTLRALMRAGASIVELNTVRKHLSALKGGQLAARWAPSGSLTLALSDVPGDDPALIGSGPTVPDPSTYGEALRALRAHGVLERIPASVRHHLEDGQSGRIAETPKSVAPRTGEQVYALMGTLDDALDAAVIAGSRVADRVVLLGRCLYGQVAEHAVDCARILRTLRGETAALLIAGGEPVLRVSGDGQGGRAQEFALRLACELEGEPGITVLVAGTDGRDGPTEAAGGFADGGTMARARRAGCDPSAALVRNDSNPALAAAGDLFLRGPTGTNVADLVVAWVDRC